MQNNDMADKRKLLFDGEEIPGLVNIEEIPYEEAIIEVPELSKIRKVKNGVTPVPLLNCIYKTNRNTNTYEFFKNFKERNEVKQVTMVQVDASNIEFKRTLFPGCECAKFTEPGYDAASPTYAQTSIILVPYDYIPLPT